MANGPIELHEIPYERLFPWVRLFRAFGVATDAKKLLLAAVGLTLLNAGWAGLDRLFPRAEPIHPGWPLSVRASFETRSIGWVRDRTPDPRTLELLESLKPALPPDQLLERLWSSLHSAGWRLTEPVRALVGPFLIVFDPRNSWASIFQASLTALWGAAVWGLIGGAIVRIALVQVARGERVGTGEALRFAIGRGATLVGTPLSPLLAVAFLAALCALFGLVYRIPAAGPVVAGALAVLPLLAGLVMAIILIGLALGWPLMPAAVAAEGEDGFDAVSRMYAYVNQRRGHYLGYVVLAWLIGIVGLIFVDVVARVVVQLTHWALSFGAPRALLGGLFGTNAASAYSAAVTLHSGWLGFVALLAHGWIYSYFWSVAGIMYLLLRHGVDGTPFHQIHRPEAERDPFAIAPAPAPTSEPTASADPQPVEPA